MRWEVEIGWKLFGIGLMLCLCLIAWIGKKNPPTGGGFSGRVQ